MDAELQNSLPWDALRHTTGPIPWAALEQIAGAVTTDHDALEDLLDLFDESDGDPYDRHSFERLYVPAVLAMAAPRLSDVGRNRAAGFLLRALTLAGDEEDEFMEDVLPAAIGVLGPEAVLPAVLEFMPEDFQPWSVAFGLWQMAALARDTKDQGLRDRIAQMCVRALQMAEAGQVDIREVEMAAGALARIGHVESRPLLQRLYAKTESPDLQDDLDVLDGTSNFPVDEEPWHRPVRQWLEKNWKLLREWYDDDEGSEDEEGDGDDEEDAAHRRASELAAEFAKSAVLANTSDEIRDHAESIAFHLLHYAWTYEGARPEDLTEPVLREVLLEIFPRKISADHDFYDDVAPLTQAFLDWLQGKGIMADSAPLREAVRGWREQIVARGMDPRHWGMAKSFAMAAQQSGVDITDTAAMNRFAAAYNQRLSEQHGNDPEEYQDADSQFDPLPPATTPIARSEPKIGPNSPCPCGSGKKHKKCCGRR